jgi:uncharacterized protein YcaQ
MVSLTWDRVRAWRLGQHHLLERASRSDMLTVVRDIGVIQAQVMSAAELQLWARLQDITSADIQNALWKDRSLVKTWSIRGTLHLLAAADFPLYIAALSTLRHFEKPAWQKAFVSLNTLNAIIKGVQESLTDSGMTREQLADAVVAHTGNAELGEALRSGWGALLKPPAFKGHLAFGPNQGQNVTFVRPDLWLGEWQTMDSGEAFKEIARRFLNAYGPATIDEFVRWIGLEPRDAKATFKALGDEIAEVDVEGWKAWVLTSAIPTIEQLSPTDNVRLLPMFDPYVIAVARHSASIMPEAFKGKVYRPQGWISAAVLVGGRIEGVWDTAKKRSQTTVTVEMFAPPTERVKQSIDAEAERLSKFLASDVAVTYA